MPGIQWLNIISFIWEQRKRLIAYIESLNDEQCIPYKIVDWIGLQKKIIITEKWQNFSKIILRLLRVGWN